MSMDRITFGNRNRDYSCKTASTGKTKSSAASGSAFTSTIKQQVNKRDSVMISASARDTDGYSVLLKNTIKEAADDITKQASIERKNEVKAKVESGEYVVDAKAVAAKIIGSGFDLSI